METKRCSCCGEVKDISEFSKSSRSKDGKQPKCKECVNLYYLNNRDARLQKKKEYYEKNRDKILASEQKRYTRQSERLKQQAKDFRKNNPDKHNSLNARTRASKLQALPKWLTEDDKWMMKEAYSLAQLRTRILGFMWHVDHIVPLRGKTVCGLHVPWNLQVIPAVANLSKSNQWIE
jgi:hypothetical protein